MYLSTTLLFGLIVTTLAAPSHNAAARDQLADPAYRDLVPREFTDSTGETSTIWIHKGWTPAAPEEEDEASTSHILSRRQRFSILGASSWKGSSSRQDRCGHSSFIDRTSNTSPYTGGCHKIREWHAANNGYWDIAGINVGSGGDDHKVLMIAGSNSGANCRFAIKHSAWKARIGNTDVSDVMRDAHNRFARFFNNAQRLGATGTMGCSADLVKDGNAAVHWRIDATKSPV